MDNANRNRCFVNQSKQCRISKYTATKVSSGKLIKILITTQIFYNRFLITKFFYFDQMRSNDALTMNFDKLSRNWVPWSLKNPLWLLRAWFFCVFAILSCIRPDDFSNSIMTPPAGFKIVTWIKHSVSFVRCNWAIQSLESLYTFSLCHGGV